MTEPRSFPLSFEQEGLLFEESFSEEGNGHSVLNISRLPQHDRSLVESAWRSVIRRHDALRSSIDVASGLQTIEEDRRVDLSAIDMSGHADEDAADAMAELVREHRDAPVERGEACPARATLVAHRSFGPLLVSTFDHLVGDCESASIVERELVAALAGADPSMAESQAPAYGPYAERQRALSQSEGWVDEEAVYWERALAGVQPVTDLVPSSGEDGTRYDVKDVLWQPANGRQHGFLALSKASRSTPGPVLLALAAATVASIAGDARDTRLPVLVALTSRRKPEFRPMVGCMFNNRLVPIATDLDDTVLGNVGRAKAAVVGALQHSRVSLAELAGALPDVAASHSRAGTLIVEIAFTPVVDARWLAYGPGAPRYAPDETAWSVGYRELVRDPAPHPWGIDHLSMRVFTSSHGVLIETSLRSAQGAASLVQRITDGVVALATSSGEQPVRQVLSTASGWS
jgi:hypothetical protein